MKKSDASAEPAYLRVFNRSLRRVFYRALRISLKNFPLGIFFLKALFYQKKAERQREKSARQGICAPAVMIASITAECNLSCQWCYARARETPPAVPLSPEEWKGIFRQAGELGISLCLISGGEPFLRRDVLERARFFPGIIFPVFTNGLLLGESEARWLRYRRNIIPVVSLEGGEEGTDRRRGAGVHRKLEETLGFLKKHGIFSGVSITLTSKNFSEVLDKRFIGGLVRLGVSLFLFVEYTPVEGGTEHLILKKEQRQVMSARIRELYSLFPVLFEAFPGEEEQYGGCLAAGRGFIHVNARGDLEPCPFAPFSDINLRHRSLKEALQSGFLKRIRDSHSKLTEKEGGCSLWNEREWVRSLLALSGREEEAKI